MTSVRIGIFAPSSTGDDRRPSGSIEWRPTRRRTVSGNVVLPAPFTVGLLATAPVIEVAPTGADWVWRVVERVQGGAPDYRYLAVPNVGTVVDYADLVEVDPETLDAVAPLTPAWQAALDAGLAGAKNRANHTGTQPASTVTGLAPVATSGAYADLSGRPTLAPVAASGAYADLIGKPAIPAAPGDIGAQPAGSYATTSALTSGLATKADTASLAPVATAGTYTSLTGKPTIPTTAAQVGADPAGTGAAAAAAAQAAAVQRANHTGTQAASTITGLATVAISGAYADLSGKPAIPAAPGDIGAQPAGSYATPTTAAGIAAGMALVFGG